MSDKKKDYTTPVVILILSLILILFDSCDPNAKTSQLRQFFALSSLALLIIVPVILIWYQIGKYNFQTNFQNNIIQKYWNRINENQMINYINNRHACNYKHDDFRESEIDFVDGSLVVTLYCHKQTVSWNAGLIRNNIIRYTLPFKCIKTTGA
jgi:hypothetical protein